MDFLPQNYGHNRYSVLNSCLSSYLPVLGIVMAFDPCLGISFSSITILFLSYAEHLLDLSLLSQVGHNEQLSVPIEYQKPLGFRGVF